MLKLYHKRRETLFLKCFFRKAIYEVKESIGVNGI